MEMKYVVPDMAQSFGTLEFAGESEPVFERDKNNRRVLARRSYNLYSDVQKGENVVVEIPVQAGEKKFKYEQKVKLVNPKLYGRGYSFVWLRPCGYFYLFQRLARFRLQIQEFQKTVPYLARHISFPYCFTSFLSIFYKLIDCDFLFWQFGKYQQSPR